MSGRHLSSSRAHVAPRAAPEQHQHQLLSWHTEMGQTELHQQLPHCCTHTTTLGVKKPQNIGFSVQTRVGFFPSVIPQPWEWVSKIGFIAPFHWNGTTRQQMLQHGEEFSPRLKLNLKEEQLPALSVLRQLSKEKSRFRKCSDLFDDFVISVLELRLFYMCFKIRKSWSYVRG